MCWESSKICKSSSRLPDIDLLSDVDTSITNFPDRDLALEPDTEIEPDKVKTTNYNLR